jgi:muramoyltetrapeptide carboxypeptidase
MDIPTIHPPAIRTGDTIGIIAPAGSLEERSAFEQGVARLEGLGFRVRFDDRIFQSLRYLAGDDAARANELMRYFEDPGIKAILSLRGGFGCSRLIPLLEEKRLRPYCKLFMGFSDLTTLHLYFRRRFGWITIHGPMAASQSLPGPGSGEASHFLSLLTDSRYLPSFSFPELETWFPGVAEGKLAGGCLSLVVASLGTPYEIKTEGKVLFLEDLSEPPYRIDRMLTQLRLAGKLDSIAGILLGRFTDCEPTQGNYTLRECLQDLVVDLNVPVLANFPAGHGPENWALPLGVKIRLNADSRLVEFLEPAVREKQ